MALLVIIVAIAAVSARRRAARRRVADAPTSTSPLAPCPDCGTRVSARAAACPHCGAPLASGRSRVLAAVLAIVLGGIGAHKFYLGRPGMGILYLLFCWTFIPAVLGLLEGLYYLSMSADAFSAMTSR